MPQINPCTQAWMSAVVLLAEALLAPKSAFAQAEPQLSISATKQWASADRALDPVGLTVGLAVFPVPAAGIRVTWTRLWGSREYPQDFCDSYWPSYLNCANEQALHHASERRLELGATFIPLREGGWKVAYGVGVGWTWLHASGASLVSGRLEEGALSASSRGLAMWGGIDRRLDRTGRLSGSVEVHRMVGEILHGCVTDTYAPFCRSFSGTSVRVGLILAPWGEHARGATPAQPN